MSAVFSNTYIRQLHIIEPCFLVIENQGFLPEPFTCKGYLDKVQEINVTGGAVVSGSFQGFDQNYRIDSLLALSNKKAVDQRDQIPLFN